MSENIYRDAADAIRKYGWKKGTMGTTKIGFCLAGALDYVVKPKPSLSISVEAMFAAVEVRYILDDQYPECRDESYGIAAYNDKVLKTADEAIAILEKAAVKFEEIV